MNVSLHTDESPHGDDSSKIVFLFLHHLKKFWALDGKKLMWGLWVEQDTGPTEDSAGVTGSGARGKSHFRRTEKRFSVSLEWLLAGDTIFSLTSNAATYAPVCLFLRETLLFLLLPAFPDLLDADAATDNYLKIQRRIVPTEAAKHGVNWLIKDIQC